MDSLLMAGRAVAGVREKVRRYCGLHWGGGVPETWAYPYFDLVETDPERVVAVDVLAAGAVHPGLSHSDLAYFVDHAPLINEWLSRLPAGMSLEGASGELLVVLAEPLAWPTAPFLTLLSKVLHRKRPELIPMVDRHVLDWYRPAIGERTARAAWPLLLEVLRADLRANASTLAAVAEDLGCELDKAPSHLRILDIALWMEGRS